MTAPSARRGEAEQCHLASEKSQLMSRYFCRKVPASQDCLPCWGEYFLLLKKWSLFSLPFTLRLPGSAAKRAVLQANQLIGCFQNARWSPGWVDRPVIDWIQCEWRVRGQSGGLGFLSMSTLPTRIPGETVRAWSWAELCQQRENSAPGGKLRATGRLMHCSSDGDALLGWVVKCPVVPEVFPPRLIKFRSFHLLSTGRGLQWTLW